MTVLAPAQQVDERAARRSIGAQIERLEADLVALNVAGGAAPSAGPRLLGLGELERTRDAMVERVERARRDRALFDDMHRHPERHRWRRITNADLGEPGCRRWEVRPRWGLIGLLGDWWRVVVSSGCPLRPGGSLRPT